MTDSGQLLQTKSNRNRIFYGYSHIVLYARIPFRHFPDHPDSLPVQRRIDSTDHFNIFQTSIRVDNERARDTSLYSILLSNSRIFYACCQIFNNEACPPGNSGICCTTVKTRPDVSTSLICLCTIREDVFFFPPESRKVTGTVYLTLTALPRCFPGDHTGMEFITRKASSFSSGLTPRITSASEIAPSFPTTKEQLTRPSIPFLTADSGYLTFVARNFSRAPCPPGNSGKPLVTGTSGRLNSFLR